MAKELGKTVKELEDTMGADELMEWVAFFKATNEEMAKQLNQQIAEEASEKEKVARLRNFLGTIGHKVK